MNLAKFGAGSVGKMLGHYTRATDEDGNYLTYPRSEGGAGHIHRERTQENYTIGECHDAAWIDERLKGVYQKPDKRHEPPRLCDIVVTLPRTEDPANAEAFFQAAYDSLARLYGGRNNVVGAWVHRDEAQPHMHFAFLPISERKSKQKPEYKEKLSVREYWPRKNSLQMMHRTVQRDVDAALGHHVDLTFAEKSKDRDELNKMTISQYKAETARRRELLNLKNEEVEELKNTVKHVEGGVFSHEHAEMSRNTVRRIFDIARHVDLFRQNAEEQEKAREDADKRAEEADERAAKARKSAETSLDGARRSRREVERMQEAMRWYDDAPDDVKENVRQYVEQERQKELKYQRNVQRDCVRACITSFRSGGGRKGFAQAVASVSQELDSIGVHGYKAQAAFVKECLSASAAQARREYRFDKRGNAVARRDDVPVQHDGGGAAGGTSWDADKHDTDYLHDGGGVAFGGRLDGGHEDIGPWELLSDMAKAEKEMEEFMREVFS